MFVPRAVDLTGMKAMDTRAERKDDLSRQEVVAGGGEGQEGREGLSR